MSVAIALLIGACLGVAFGWCMRAMMERSNVDAYRAEARYWRSRAHEVD